MTSEKYIEKDDINIKIHENINEKINYFLSTKNIPHIIFHGPSGTGKKTIVYNFINSIYENDKHKIKENVLHVNCSHGKGIKFIREELKFFAMKNIQSNSGVMFKSIILLDADFLTIDAQSALRRCIEQFSNNTRFFIIVENKHKLLNPILSRFCEIYVPEYIINNRVMNLHQYSLDRRMDFSDIENQRTEIVKTKMDWLIENRHINSNNMNSTNNINHKNNNISSNINDIVLVQLSSEFYENGISCLDIIKYIENSNYWTNIQISEYLIEFYNIKSEYRCEKLLLFYLLNMIFMRS
jgi:DNA polymerase III delta prime subunit